MIKYKIGCYDVFDIVLGKGNFATVYRAIHKVSGCQVAMKIINRNDVQDEYVARNLHREAKVLAKLRHPNIMQFYESMTTKDLYCLSLELIKGVTLYQYFKIKLVPRLDENKAKLFFYQMLAAVQHMHHQKILHRDLKQENILIEHDQFVKIVDFGLSNVYYPKVIQRTRCGSMEYAAPELFHHISYSPAIDLWSLGVVLYSMVVGKMPFTLPRNGPISSQRRDLFVKRISKGLTQENWREMENLTGECWDLILSLLQPDSNSRIRIERALHHKWFKNNFELRHYLPQVRIDLRKKLRPEVIRYLSEKLCTPAEKISRSVITYQHNHISAMYNLTLDTLIKEIIHPPRDIEQSFLCHFERWRMTKLRPNRSDYVEPGIIERTRIIRPSEQYQAPRKVRSVEDNVFIHNNEAPVRNYRNRVFHRREQCEPNKVNTESQASSMEQSKNIEPFPAIKFSVPKDIKRSVCESTPDSNHEQKSYINEKIRPFTTLNVLVPKDAKRNVSKTSQDFNDEQKVTFKQDLSDVPYRSYKLTRPKTINNDLLHDIKSFEELKISKQGMQSSSNKLDILSKNFHRTSSAKLSEPQNSKDSSFLRRENFMVTKDASNKETPRVILRGEKKVTDDTKHFSVAKLSQDNVLRRVIPAQSTVKMKSKFAWSKLSSKENPDENQVTENYISGDYLHSKTSSSTIERENRFQNYKIKFAEKSNGDLARLSKVPATDFRYGAATANIRRSEI